MSVVPGVLAALLVIPAALSAQSFDVTPWPSRLDPAAADYQLSPSSRIVVSQADSTLRPAAELLRGIIRSETGLALGIVDGPPAGNDIVIALSTEYGAYSEAYDLRADPGRVSLQAASPAAAIWGVQTLRQLLVRVPLHAAPPAESWRIRGAGVRDRPGYAWRGVLLDVARHFLPVAAVKRQIDLMSRYKLNVLHWHLTDDQGWRLEVRRYPRLTSVGAWRTEADGSRYGGFYTQAEVREVVAYAQARGITVVPEIEMPGHASAAIAAYPELGCTGDAIAVPTTWGVFDDILCAGNERTFEFLRNVLDEVVELFPSRYLHVGGDEVPKVRWQACEACQAVIRREGLRDEAQLQSWFLTRIGRHLASRGKRMIGWDEILEGGLPEGAAVQVWRDTAAIGQALRAGTEVVASPTSHAYINGSPRELPLERVYAFDPAVGRTAEERARVFGGEATLWSEFIDEANLDLVAWPRLLAFAEAMWTARPSQYPDFRARLPGQYRRLRDAGVHVGPESTDVMRVGIRYDSTRRLVVSAEPGAPGVVLRYRLGGGEPDSTSPAIDSVERFASGPLVLRTFANNRPTLLWRRLDFAEHLGRGRPVTAPPPAGSYQGTGPRTLTDGWLATTDHHDGLWHGWQGRDVEILIALDEVMEVRTVEASLLESATSWILLPRAMSVQTSPDSASWTPAATVVREAPDGRIARRASLRLDLPAGTRARYVRLILANGGPLPEWHAAAGRRSWIFADEIIVR